MNLLLWDHRPALLYPLSLTRPVAELRFGLRTIKGKWEARLGTSASHLTEPSLAALFPSCSEGNDHLVINGRLLPEAEVSQAILALQPEEALIAEDGTFLAMRSATMPEMPEQASAEMTTKAFAGAAKLLHSPWQLFRELEDELVSDIEFEAANCKKLSEGVGNTVIGDHPVWVAPGAEVNGAILNTTKGPIYIGKNAEVMEGSVIRGPFGLCEGGVVKLASKIYGPTMVGPFSKVGGELNNCNIQGYSNKGHDGFMGNSVMGQWCNLGADTNTSNLKNNYSNVRVWNYDSGKSEDSGLQFHGLVMGDHSKCGINTMFNTGTVVGVSANVYGGGFPPKFIPSFAWGGADGFVTYRLDKACEVAKVVCARRSVEFTDQDATLLGHIMSETAGYRSKENGFDV